MTESIQPATDEEIAMWEATASNYTGCTTERLIVRLRQEQARVEALENKAAQLQQQLNEATLKASYKRRHCPNCIGNCD